MPQTTVTVDFVNQPDKNPKFGSIKSSAGDYYGVPKESLALFQKGGTYEIQYGETPGRNGKVFRNFERMVGASPQNQTAVNGKEESMFITGFVNRLWASTGVVPAEADIETALRNAQGAWRRVQAEDEIPY